MPFLKENLLELIKNAIKYNASDIHIRADEKPSFRIMGELATAGNKSISKTDILDILKLVTKPQDIEYFKKNKNLEGSFEISKVCRVRYSVFRYMGKIGIVLRLLKTEIPTLEQLNLSSALKSIATQKKGLVLITGQTGSGKSTTLAAMINYINNNMRKHIITIEDPVEYVHHSIKSCISQRQIPEDIETFNLALQTILRQDPDTILIGEIRDHTTVSMALKAAETGHAVFATLHTTNVLTTIGRIVALFPAEEQNYIKKRLANNLYSVISQQIIKRRDNKGVVAAQEIMVTNQSIRECINGSEPVEQLPVFIEHASGPQGNGCQTFEQHIMQLYKDGLISKESALSSVSSQTDFMQKLITDTK